MIKKFEDKMQKSIESLEREYNSIRAGRANPHVLDKIKVDYYGTPTPLQQVGNISVPEPRIITIQPWETSLLKAIEKEIMQSDIGINPTNDGFISVIVWIFHPDNWFYISEFLQKFIHFLLLGCKLFLIGYALILTAAALF